MTGGALTLSALAGAPALAHDQLLSTTPKAESTVQTTPEEIRLTFSGNLISGQGIQNLVHVRDEDSNQWQAGEATAAGPELSTALCEGMPNGDYDVSYRVVYSDGHSEEKAYGFTLNDPVAPDSGAPADGCGVAVTAASAEAGTTASAAAQPGAITQTPATATEEPASAGQAEAADQAVGQSVPGWVWAVGLAGLAVVILGVVMVFRKSRSLNGGDPRV